MKPLLISILILALFSCKEEKREKQTYELAADAQIWYDTTKALIKQQANLVADSTSVEVGTDSTWKDIFYYSNDHYFKYEAFRKGLLRARFEFSKDNKFELRQEICDNGNLVFEGIFFEGNAYGPSTWYNGCKGVLSDAGIRFEDKQIGIWTYQEDGQISYKDKGQLELVESLPRIRS